MKLKNLFNVILYSFLMIVPLVPIKVKVAMFPMAADFILGAVLIFVGILCVLDMYRKKEKITGIFKDNTVKLLTVFIGIFVLMGFFSSTYASHRVAAISETLRFLEYVFIFYLVVILCDRQGIKRSLRIFYFVMLFASLFGVLQYIFNWSIFTAGGFFGRGRIMSTFENPNYWGAAVNIVIFYPLISLIEGKSKNKVFDIFSFILLLFNLIFSSTRGSWLGFAIGVLVICLVRYRKKIIYFLGIFIAMLLVPSIRSRFLDLFNVKERLALWKTGFYMFRDNFWLGVGNGNYIFKYQQYIKKYKQLDLGKLKFSVHNSYIKMFAELGIFGGLIFIFMYLNIFAIAYKVYKRSMEYKLYALSFLGFGAAYLFQNFFNNLAFIPQLNVFVWIIAALLYKGFYIERQGE